MTAFRALHSKLFSEIRVEFRVGMSLSRVETRRVVRHFFRYFRKFRQNVITKTRENKNREKTLFSRFFCEKMQFFAKIRVGMSFRESRRIRKKLKKLAPTLIFVKRRLPKLAKTKILAKAVFRRALTAFTKSAHIFCKTICNCSSSVKY